MDRLPGRSDSLMEQKQNKKEKKKDKKIKRASTLGTVPVSVSR